ncbi:unnamed protein product [Zymoseptoria tritici ST99CH_3D1]|nr:unnamed protein product [Zymoseptoria tritici ST99CH_3D1]
MSTNTQSSHDDNNPIHPSHGLRTRAIQPTPRFDLITKTIAIDIEFIIFTPNPHRVAVPVRAKKRSLPGRVSIVNNRGETIYDVFVYYKKSGRYTIAPPPPHLRMGVYEKDVLPSNGARPAKEVFDNVRKIVEGRIVVGHAIKNDVKSFPREIFEGVQIRDTQLLEEYRNHATDQINRMPKLARLAGVVLGRSIQGPEHSSVEDAVATMDLYRLREGEFETTQKHPLKQIDPLLSLRLFDSWVSSGEIIASLVHSPRVWAILANPPGADWRVRFVFRGLLGLHGNGPRSTSDIIAGTEKFQDLPR